MKKLSLIGLVFMAQGAFAAQLNLTSGEQATIEANSKTVVTCNGGTQPGSDCALAAQGFKTTLEYCQKTYSGGYCSENYWPKYKAANPNCVYAGASACLEACIKTYSGGYCAERCQ